MVEVLENNVMIPVVWYVLAFLLGFSSLFLAKATAWGKGKKMIELLPLFLLVTYIFLVLASTLFSRSDEGIFRYKLKLFWSFSEAAAGENPLIPWEIFFNFLMLLPLGFLYPMLRKSSLLLSALQGFGLSLFIEVSQLVTKRGLFEFDDLFNNTLGCMVGYLLFLLCRHIHRRIGKDR